MNLQNVEKHHGVSLLPIKEQTTHNLFEVKDIQISDLPVKVHRARTKDEGGGKQLAYEIGHESMTEVLAGLRNCFSPPVGQALILKLALISNN